MVGMRNFFGEIESLKKQVEEDFDYYNTRQSMIYKRIKLLQGRDLTEENAAELEQMLKAKREVKERVMQLLPLRDMFKHEWTDVCDRLKNAEENRKRIQDELRQARLLEKEVV
jgi:ABC-type ATPase involved in cell division